CGLRGALCTLHLVRSVFTSSTGATRGRSGGLDLAPQGLAPCKKRQASLGALTPAVSRARKRERGTSGRWRTSAPLPGSARPSPRELSQSFRPAVHKYYPSLAALRASTIPIPRGEACLLLPATADPAAPDDGQ